MADDNNAEVESAALLDSVEELESVKKTIPFPSCRLVLSVMGFLGFVNVYALRVNLSVAMVAMVNSSYQATKNATVDACPADNTTQNSTHMVPGEFNWDSNIQGLVLGSFFYGYIVTQVPGGFLAERLGGKWLFGVGVLCTSVFTLLTPIAARINVYLFIVVRVLEGLGEGVTFPAMTAMLAHWAPPYERSKLGTFIFAGAQFGTVISLPISGILCDRGPFGGWPSVFYLFGGLGCLWFVAWCFLSYNFPSVHPRISIPERTFIEESIGREQEEKLPVPWPAILTSLPFWAVLMAHTCNNWGFYTLLTCMPTYMKEVLQFDMTQNGFLSAIPYLVQCIMSVGSGQVADYLRYKHILSTTKVRKLAVIIGLGTPAITLAVIGYAGCDKMLIVALLAIAVGVGGVTQSGYGVNHLDLATPFAGTLMGLTNASATIPGFVGPLVVGLLTKDNNGFLSAIPYLVQVIMGTGSGQVADHLRYKHILSTTNVRKLAIIIGLGTPAITLAVISYAGCNKVLIVTLLTLAVGVSGVSWSGFLVNHLDLAAPFAGTLAGLTNTSATIPGFVGPLIVGLLTKDNNGMLSAIPYLVQGILMAGSGQVADYLRYKHILSTTKVRKLAIIVGLGTPAITLAVIGYAGCDKILIVALLTIAVGVGGVSQSGYGVNHLDLAAPFAGTLFGLTNAAATIPGFVGPQIVGVLTHNNPSRARWQIVFWISSAIYAFGTIFYVIFGSGELQPWAKPEYAELQRDIKSMKRHNKQSARSTGSLQISRPYNVADT